MRIFYLLVPLMCFMLQPTFSQKGTVDRFFNSPSLKTCSYSIYAMDAKTGENVCQTEQKSLSSASVMKLLTSAVSLELLGPDYTFSTALYYSGNIDPINGTLHGDLILQSGGDPAFYSSFFKDHYANCYENWVTELKKKGIKKVDGNLLIDLSAMGQTAIPGGWCWDDVANYYGSGVSSLSFGDNWYDIHFTSSKTEGIKTDISSIQPEIADLKLENYVLSSARSGDHTIVYGAPGSPLQHIEGTIPTGQADFVVKAAMPDPPLVAGSLLLKKMNEHGIMLSGKLEKTYQEDQTNKSLIGIQLSPPLKDLIVVLNKESHNLFAEHLMCEIGRKKFGEPSTAKGLEACLQFCTEKGIDSHGFFPADGSGLSRSNALTSKLLVDIMKYMYDGRYREFFFNSLPVAGVDGTLRNSFKGTPLEKNLTAKTGSMSRVRSIAGKLTSRKGKTILFAILINNFELTTPEASKLLESILMSVYND